MHTMQHTAMSSAQLKGDLAASSTKQALHKCRHESCNAACTALQDRSKAAQASACALSQWPLPWNFQSYLAVHALVPTVRHSPSNFALSPQAAARLACRQQMGVTVAAVLKQLEAEH